MPAIPVLKIEPLIKLRMSLLRFAYPVLFSPNLSAAAQTSVRVAVLDGHTAKPVAGAHVSIIVVHNNSAGTRNAVPDGDEYVVQVKHGDTLVLGEVTKKDGSWNEYALCATGVDTNPIYSVDAILEKGLQAPNTCDRRITAKLAQGQIVFYVTRLPFWKRFHLFLD